MAEDDKKQLNEVELEFVDEERDSGRVLKKRRCVIKGKQQPTTLINYAKKALEE